MGDRCALSQQTQAGDLTFSSATHAWSVLRFQKFYLREGGWRSVTKHPVKDDRIGLLLLGWWRGRARGSDAFPRISHFLLWRRRFLAGGEQIPRSKKSSCGWRLKICFSWSVHYHSNNLFLQRNTRACVSHQLVPSRKSRTTYILIHLFGTENAL